MLHIQAVAFPSSLIASLALLLAIGLGIGSTVEYIQKKDKATGKKYLISSGTFALVWFIAYVVYRIAR